MASFARRLALLLAVSATLAGCGLRDDVAGNPWDDWRHKVRGTSIDSAPRADVNGVVLPLFHADWFVIDGGPGSSPPTSPAWPASATAGAPFILHLTTPVPPAWIEIRSFRKAVTSPRGFVKNCAGGVE
ncbi:hypothetical protein AAH991_15375 [Microbispora sp. ZYX-F-249]|uniref:Lipoprotein n=1 Tax=Microbispora maris TaxID=3144104 RepID=A0ABV0AP80_9ACTN